MLYNTLCLAYDASILNVHTVMCSDGQMGAIHKSVLRSDGPYVVQEYTHRAGAEAGILCGLLSVS